MLTEPVLELVVLPQLALDGLRNLSFQVLNLLGLLKPLALPLAPLVLQLEV